MSGEWNHNIHYHSLVLSTVPRPCARALDVGCGGGLLTRQLPPHCDHVTGIDSDAEVVRKVIAPDPSQIHVRFVSGDVMTYPFPAASFTFITAVATLHHLPLEPALIRFRELLAPGGTLTIIGLYSPKGMTDRLFAIAGMVTSWFLKRFHHYAEVGAPMTNPKETLTEIRKSSAKCLPGSVVKRRLLFRYSLIWSKPDENGSC